MDKLPPPPTQGESLLQMTTVEFKNFIEQSLPAYPALERLNPLAESEITSRVVPANAATATVPELFIERFNDHYIIYFASDTVPSLRLSPGYQQKLQNSEPDNAECAAIKERTRSAIELLRNIEYRRQVIYSVTEAIVRRQHEFLEKGDGYIKPVTIEDIAEDIGVSSWAVSHAVTGKYAYTPQGVIELRCLITETHEPG